jgi:hypothetical protein
MKLLQNALSLFNLINIGFKYVMETSSVYKIDESHALKHSIEVFDYAKKIYESELKTKPYLENQREIIYMSAIGHDMCDKKYMDEKQGILRYTNYLSDYMKPADLSICGKIIETMSYSKVKANGYPELGEYQLAYHIVREADLLASYDIHRCIIYRMYRSNIDYTTALEEAVDLFNNRVFTMRKDKLFVTDFSKKESLKLHKKTQKDVKHLESFI